MEGLQVRHRRQRLAELHHRRPGHRLPRHAQPPRATRRPGAASHHRLRRLQRRHHGGVPARLRQHHDHHLGRDPGQGHPTGRQLDQRRPPHRLAGPVHLHPGAEHQLQRPHAVLLRGARVHGGPDLPGEDRLQPRGRRSGQLPGPVPRLRPGCRHEGLGASQRDLGHRERQHAALGRQQRDRAEHHGQRARLQRKLCRDTGQYRQDLRPRRAADLGRGPHRHDPGDHVLRRRGPAGRLSVPRQPRLEGRHADLQQDQDQGHHDGRLGHDDEQADADPGQCRGQPGRDRHDRAVLRRAADVQRRRHHRGQGRLAERLRQQHDVGLVQLRVQDLPQGAARRRHGHRRARLLRRHRGQRAPHRAGQRQGSAVDRRPGRRQPGPPRRTTWPSTATPSTGTARCSTPWVPGRSATPTP